MPIHTVSLNDEVMSQIEYITYDVSPQIYIKMGKRNNLLLGIGVGFLILSLYPVIVYPMTHINEYSKLSKIFDTIYIIFSHLYDMKLYFKNIISHIKYLKYLRSFVKQ